MVYFVLNSGAPVESSHWVKNHVSDCPDAASATLRRSSTVAPLPAYCDRKVRMVLSNGWSPMTHRSIFSTLAPLSVTSDWNSGENTSSLPTCDSGTLM